MNKQKISDGKSNPQVVNKFSDLMQFFRLGKAAELLECSADELLHLGATGRLEIVAPIVAPGEFAWPVENESVAFIEIDEPFVRYFDASSRVALFPSDLAKIEAVGWAVPWRFYAPNISREIIAQAPRTFEDSLVTRNEKRVQRDTNANRSLAQFIKKQSGKDFEENSDVDFPFPRDSTLALLEKGTRDLRESGFYSAWMRTDAVDEDAPKTTIEHLFISHQELVRLRDGLPQTHVLPDAELKAVPERVHGNTERNSKNRFEILFAAVWLSRKTIKEVVGSGKEWAQQIDIRIWEIWPDKRPMALATIEDLLEDVLSERGLDERVRSKNS